MDDDELLRIREDMVNRGPDGYGIWFSEDRRVGLAHRRLSIIDLSNAASQPMTTEDGRLCITFNGEIYNYRELRKRLENKGYRFRTNSDTEVLLHLYDNKGRDMVHDLRGMYAFAIWDNRRQGLLLARDPYGIKPLYYSDDGHTLRVASQVKALLAGGGISLSPNPAGHVSFFLWGYVPEPHTMYREIRALPAGSTVWVDRQGVGPEHMYCSVGRILAEASQNPVRLPVKEAEAVVRNALLEAVRAHLEADVPVGIFLSAGIDSMSLVALASEVMNAPIKTVTLAFEEYRGTPMDESILAEKSARHYGTDHVTRMMSYQSFANELPRILSAMDQPSIDGANTYFVSKVAAETGLKCVLSGLGGDELFGGYPSFRQIPRMVQLFRPFSSVSGLGRGFRWVSGPILKHFTSPKYAGLLEYGGTYGGAYLLRRGLFMPWELPEILDPDLVRAGWEALQPLIGLETEISGISVPRLSITALESAWYMRSQLLRDSDWASMTHSLELRVPLVDIELLKKIAPILADPEQPLGKSLLVQSPQKALPLEIQQRPKTGFAIPVTQWLLERYNQPEAGGKLDVLKHRGHRAWALQVYENWEV